MNKKTEKMRIEHSEISVIVPPGVYFLGDPMAAIAPSHWRRILHSSNDFETPVAKFFDHVAPREYEVLGFAVHISSMATLDGQFQTKFKDQNGWLYTCLSGFIGLTPEIAFLPAKERMMAEVGGFVTLTSDCRCICRSDGRLNFGDVVLETMQR